MHKGSRKRNSLCIPALHEIMIDIAMDYKYSFHFLALAGADWLSKYGEKLFFRLAQKLFQKTFESAFSTNT